MPFEMVLNALHNAYSWNFADHRVSQKLTVPHVGGPSGGAVVKNPPANVGDIRYVGLIPGLGRSPAGGHANPLQCSCLENPTDRRSLEGCSPGLSKPLKLNN